MGDIPDTAATLKYIKTELPELSKQNKKSEAAFKKTKADLEKAISTGTIPMLKLLKPILQKEVDEMDDAMAKGEEAKTQINALSGDPAYADSHADLILGLMETVTGIQSELTERLKQAADLDTRASKASDQAEDSKEEGIKQLAVLKDDVGDLKKLVEKNGAEAPKVEAAARKAYDDRDIHALEAAKTKIGDFLKVGERAVPLRDKVEKFKHRFAHSYKDLDTEAQWLLDDLHQIEDRRKELLTLLRAIFALGLIEPVDTDKAAKILFIANPKDKAKLEKALSGQAAGYLKALDALAKDKDFTVKTTGKDMYAKLKSAKVI